ncbi:MAG: methyl-accepting chemotaxis protein, partial [Gammaproteobacteria bacterium]
TMAQSITEVSENASRCANVAMLSLNAANGGAEAVRSTIANMDEIRAQIQETAKRIKRLGESSQEIGDIVSLIENITEQTNVLALNAAIQAAAAGEAGRGFTIVAEEVQRLAERSTKATKEIAARVKSIQADTTNAVVAMEQSTNRVVEGTKLSVAVNQALLDIQNVTPRLANLVQSISVATQKQTEIAEQVSFGMTQILEVTDKTTAGAAQIVTSVIKLGDTARNLRGSVARFRL